MVPRILIAAAALALSSAAAPRPWLKVTSTNFELYTDAGEKKARDAILYFEQVRAFFQSLNPNYRSDVPVRIIAFNSRKEYQVYAIAKTADAYYAAGYERDHIVMGSIDRESYPVAVHEYVHLLLKPAHGKIPAWLNEGLAEVYSTLKPIGKKVQIGDVIPGRYYTLREGGGWMKAEVFASLDSEEVHKQPEEKVAMFYAQAWAFVHMLLLTKEYHPKFGATLGALGEGKSQEEVFQTVYGKPMGEFLKELERYVRSGQFMVGQYDVKLEKSAETPSVGTAGELESGLVLANLLAATGREQDARSAYDTLAGAHPESAEIQEAVGYLHFRAHDFAQARDHFLRAIKLGSRNAQMYVDYAATASDDEDAERAALRKALELKPDHVDAALRLGSRLLSDGEYEGALAALLRIQRIDKERAFALFQMLAYAQYRAGQKEEARKSLEKAKGVAKNAAERSEVERMSRALEGPVLVAQEVEKDVEEPAEEPAEEEAPPARTPRLVRRGVAAPPEALPASAFATGVLEQVDCLGHRARIRVRVSGREARFAIRNPSAVVIKGAGSGTVEFTCGEQKPRTVVIEYDGKVDGELGTTGDVVSIEFK